MRLGRLLPIAGNAATLDLAEYGRRDRTRGPRQDCDPGCADRFRLGSFRDPGGTRCRLPPSGPAPWRAGLFPCADSQRRCRLRPCAGRTGPPGPRSTAHTAHMPEGTSTLSVGSMNEAAFAAMRARRTPLRLVIFDCDGVLIDSEPLANRVVAAELEVLGWAMSPEECDRRFLGMTFDDMCPVIEAQIGRSLPDDWVSALVVKV